MSIMERWSPRAIRFTYSVFAILVLAIASYNLLHVLWWRVPSNDQCEWKQIFSDTTAVYVDRPAEKQREPYTQPADGRGLDAGDLVLAVNGKSIRSAAEAVALIKSAAHGDTIQLRVDRDHRVREVYAVRDTANVAIPFVLYDHPAMTLVITNIVPDGVTEQAGALDGDTLVRIDGVSTRMKRGAQFQLNLHPAGSVATFTILRDGHERTLKVRVLKTFNYTYFALFLLGLGFLLMGWIVVMSRPEGALQRHFARYGILVLLFFSMMQLNIGPLYDPMVKVYIMLVLFFITRTFAAPVFITFFFRFPYEKAAASRRWVTVLLYALTMLASGVILEYNFRHLGWVPPMWLLRAADLLPMTYFFAGLIVFAHSYFTIKEKERRKQLRPILQSTLIGVAVFIYVAVIATTYPLVIFLQPYLMLPALLFIGIPPAFGYAMFKHRLMDVTVIVKRSLIYGAITATIAAVYLGFVFGLGSLLGLVLDETDNKLLSLIAFVLIALMFDPLKRRVQRMVDRIFYQERYNYQQALLEFSRELPRQIKLEEILSSMVSRISSTMHVEKVAVGLCDDEHGCHIVSKNIDEQCCQFGHSQGGLLAALRESRAPVSVALVDELPGIVDAGDREQIKKSGIVLVVPMFLQDRLIGAINVGPKMSGKVYSQEDIDLLSTVAGQAAIAIENARLHASEMEKQKITEQLRIAQRIQQGLLPQESPDVPTLDISGVSIPAMSVGGDYFDYIALPDDRLLVVVGDVSGKGISAALYMAKVQGLLRFAAQTHSSPCEMLSSVNRHLYEGMERNSFITLILALFDLRAMRLTLCRAGHTPPLVLMNGDTHYLTAEGMGLGLEKGPVFDQSLREVQVKLEPNGLVLLYSDGLTEAMDRERNLFGEDRLLDLVQSYKHLPAGALQEVVLRDVQIHRGVAEQNDDITMVVIRVRES
ncbi:MAG TPA: SpoIIE family protein phosphatase [Bacteroidota bacterium]|nr:SpoIIE family protein phosphatase [Bacteroidota bacterium]